MKQKTLIISIFAALVLFGCQNKQTEKVRINPFKELEQVDNLLSELTEKPQKLTVPSATKTTITGDKGTIIHVDPNRLETVDGSSIGDNIQIELLEMTNIFSMLLNNAQTVSNGQILVTGGAYYINMTSDGKQLKIKQGKGLEVEFPKLTEDEMGLFLGERDSLGEINWISTSVNFEKKDIPDATMPDKSIIRQDEVREMVIIEMENYLLDSVTASKKDIEYQRQTYQAVELMNFGWINCDRFYNDPSPKTDIQLIVNNDSLQGARFFAVFKDIRSVMTEYYYKGRKEAASFRNIPVGKELTIIALSAKDKTPYLFETTINTETDKKVQIEFMETTQTEIKDIMKRMN